jgi:hypothetical protein
MMRAAERNHQNPIPASVSKPVVIWKIALRPFPQEPSTLWWEKDNL